LRRNARLDASYRFADAPVEIAREPHAITSLSWSGDGRTLLYQVYQAYQGRNYTKAVTDGAVRVINPGANIRISQILTDGGALGTEERGRSELWRVDLKDARHTPEKVGSIPWTDEGVNVSPDGQWVAFATTRNGPTQIWVSRIDVRSEGRNARVLIPGDSSIHPLR
jgi:Tol biopolymer transport system component